MNREFTIGAFSKIFYWVCIAVMVGFPIFLLMKFNSSSNYSANIALILILFISATLLALYTIRRKVIITSTEIIVTGMFSSRQLENKEIKGFRVISKAIKIYPKDGSGLKKLTINDYSAIGQTEELIRCLEESFPNLDMVEYKTALAEVLRDDNLGTSEDERKAKLNRARNITLSYNIIGGVVFALLIIAPEFTSESLAIAIFALLYPLVGIFIILTGNGLVKLIPKKTSAYYGISFGFFVSSLMLFVKSIITYSVDYQNFILPFVLITFIVAIPIYLKGMVKGDTPRPVTGQFFVLLAVSAMYAFGCMVFINCQFDKAPPQISTVNIDRVYILHGKRDIYRITISPSGNNYISKDMQIQSSLYNKLLGARSAHIYYKHGLLDLRWFYLGP